jgi:hypothetical protein
MSTVQRKRRRSGILLERAKQADTLRAQIEGLQRQVNDVQHHLLQSARELRNAQNTTQMYAACESELRAALNNVQDVHALREIELCDRIERLEGALTERGDHIEQVIKERDLARAARDVSDKRYHTLLDEDHDSRKLRRRLREAKATIAEQQTELWRWRRREPMLDRHKDNLVEGTA